MAVIQGGTTQNLLEIESTGAARVTLWAPDGTPLVSFLRGGGVDLDSRPDRSDVRDLLAIGVPGPGGAQVAGTSDVPLVVAGSINVANQPTSQLVEGVLSIDNLPATQTVEGVVEIANPVTSVSVDNLPATQTVAGTITVANPQTSVSVSNLPTTQQVAGTVAVSNLPTEQTVKGTITVANPTTSVAVSNFPATQAVAGTVAISNPTTSVSVSNLPATQTVAGTVGADNRVNGAAVTSANRLPVDATGTLSVANFPATQTVAGTVTVANPQTSVSVSNLPTTQQVAGTVSADVRAGGAAVSASNRLPVDATGTVSVSNLPTTQTVAGTVGADNRVNGAAVTTSNRLPVDASGTVTVANPQTSVSVSNLPATQTVAGTVAVSNLPATQQVAGSVSVSNLPSTQNVAGTVTVANPQTSVTVDGTVGARLLVGGNAVSSANAVPTLAVDPLAASIEYACVIDVAPAAAGVDGNAYWILRNAGTKTIGIRRFDLQQGFFGTAAASRSSWAIQRFSGTPAGGTAVVPARKISTSPASTATALVGTAALTMTGVTYDASPFHRQSSVNQLAATSTQDVTFAGGPLILLPGEGIAVRALGATVLGSFLTGSVGWYEL